MGEVAAGAPRDYLGTRRLNREISVDMAGDDLGADGSGADGSSVGHGDAQEVLPQPPQRPLACFVGHGDAQEVLPGLVGRQLLIGDDLARLEAPVLGDIQAHETAGGRKLVVGDGHGKHEAASGADFRNFAKGDFHGRDDLMADRDAPD